MAYQSYSMVKLAFLLCLVFSISEAASISSTATEDDASDAQDVNFTRMEPRHLHLLHNLLHQYLLHKHHHRDFDHQIGFEGSTSLSIAGSSGAVGFHDKDEHKHKGFAGSAESHSGSFAAVGSEGSHSGGEHHSYLDHHAPVDHHHHNHEVLADHQLFDNEVSFDGGHDEHDVHGAEGSSAGAAAFGSANMLSAGGDVTSKTGAASKSLDDGHIASSSSLSFSKTQSLNGKGSSSSLSFSKSFGLR